MKKLILVSFLIVASVSYLFSKATPTQKKLAKAFPPDSTIKNCYTECKKAKSVNECNNAIDDLEAAMKAMYAAAKTKDLGSSDKPVEKSLSVLRTSCPKVGEEITQALKK